MVPHLFQCKPPLYQLQPALGCIEDKLLTLCKCPATCEVQGNQLTKSCCDVHNLQPLQHLLHLLNFGLRSVHLTEL